ncbi:MAG TPA: HAMP domain-containing sensor histidine kinase [Kofleriaceae bacterium]|nr:HAMP domain-containing sensor histidine kinase [Kofleriaceae bacterium]
MTIDAYEHAACGLMQTADDGLVRRVNGTFCAWLGYTADELVGKRRFQDLLGVGSRIFHHTHWLPLLAMQGSVSEVKLDFVHRDGAMIPMVVNVVRRDDEGTIVLDVAVFIGRDRDRYEQELVLAKQRLESLVTEQRDRADFAEQLIGIVSHDLRNPLSTIGMASQMLANKDPNAQDRLVAMIDRSVDRATHLLADLLDFTAARVGNGISISVTNVDLHSTVAEAVDALHVAYPKSTLTHVTQGSGTCRADPQRISQLLGNLVSNAVSYGNPTRPIEIASRIDDVACALSVTNAGPAIPEDQLASIFLPMTRGTSKGTASRSVGLGLFIVQQIAKAHGGEARVASTHEATTFTIELPRKTA